MRITLLGTGLMGAPMARRLAAAGHRLTVWNRNPARSAALADVAQVAATPAEAVAGAEVVIAMLLDGPATRAVLHDQGALAAMPAGARVIDMGSVDPATDIALAQMAAGLGLHYLDAPVSGGVVGAEAGTLQIFVGGRPEDFAAAAPLLAVLGRPHHLGPVGAGQVTKLANQLIVGVTIAAVAEGLRLAQAAGCDPAQVQAALRGGFADSRILDLHGQGMVTGRFTPGGRAAAQLKDLRNAADLAAAQGLSTPVLQAARDGFARLVARPGGADLDHSAYWLIAAAPDMRQDTGQDVGQDTGQNGG